MTKPKNLQQLIEEIREKFAKKFLLWLPARDYNNFLDFLENACILVAKETAREGKVKKKEYEETPVPSLIQYENRGSAPFYCTLCGMSEMEIMDRKTKDKRYYCNCSYWSDPHNDYLDKSGGKWLGWYDKEYADKVFRENCLWENGFNQAVFQQQKQLKEWLGKEEK